MSDPRAEALKPPVVVTKAEAAPPKEPLVGADDESRRPEVAARRAAARAKRAGISPHGSLADALAAAERAAEAAAAKGTPRPGSAEAVDGLGSRTERAKAAHEAAERAADRAEVEARVSPAAAQTGRSVAGDRENPDAVFAAAAEAADATPENVTVASASQTADDVSPVVDSPHGRQAELADPWVAARYSSHGDMNAVAPAEYAVEQPDDPNDFTRSPSPIPR